jgi:hypothetical protein
MYVCMCVCMYVYIGLLIYFSFCIFFFIQMNSIKKNMQHSWSDKNQSRGFAHLFLIQLQALHLPRPNPRTKLQKRISRRLVLFSSCFFSAPDLRDLGQSRMMISITQQLITSISTRAQATFFLE